MQQTTFSDLKSLLDAQEELNNKYVPNWRESVSMEQQLSAVLTELAECIILNKKDLSKSVEQLMSLKENLVLDDLQVRGIKKVKVRVGLNLLVMLAIAVAMAERNRLGDCRRIKTCAA